MAKRFQTTCVAFISTVVTPLSLFDALSDKLTIILNINQVELFYIGVKYSTKFQNLNNSLEHQCTLMD